MRLKFSVVEVAIVLAYSLSVPAAKASAIVLPDAQYFESTTVGNPFSNSNSYQFQRPSRISPTWGRQAYAAARHAQSVARVVRCGPTGPPLQPSLGRSCLRSTAFQ
jgi:hypothetical protein